MRIGAGRWWFPTTPPDDGSAAPGFVRAVAEAVTDAGLERFDCVVDAVNGPVRIMIRARATGTEVEVAPLEAPEGLTMREIEVVSLVTAGLSNAGIAARLGVAPRTVATHLERALPKLGCATRAAAAVVAAHHGLLVLPVPGGAEDLPPVPLALVAERLALDDVGKGRVRSPRRPRVHRSPIVIGALYPRDPSTDADAADMRRGAELAIAVLNARGGVGGRPLRLVVEGAGADPDEIDSALARLHDADVDAVTLGYTLVRDQPLIERVFERAAAAGAPLLHTLTSRIARDLVGQERGRYSRILQVSPPESRYGAVFTDVLAGSDHRRGPRVLAVIESVEPSMQVWTPDARSYAEGAGWRIERRAFDTSAVNWASAAIDWIETVGPVCGIFAGMVMEDRLRAFLDAHARRPSGALVYAPYAPSVPGFLDRAGASAEGIVWSTTIGTGDDLQAVSFRRAFARRYGRASGRSSAATHFDMVNLLADGWRRVDSPRDFTGVTAAIAAVPTRGVNGVYAFDDRTLTARALAGDTDDAGLGKSHRVFRVSGGAHVVATARSQRRRASTASSASP